MRITLISTSLIYAYIDKLMCMLLVQMSVPDGIIVVDLQSDDVSVSIGSG